jgi:hypothetical protein
VTDVFFAGGLDFFSDGLQMLKRVTVWTYMLIASAEKLKSYSFVGLSYFLSSLFSCMCNVMGFLIV